ncbi:uncharacterized protein METZ01_LOCUS100905 [marine metagenome]|uniref:Uncharacterized protein n=1 Tax=marine metagenome TaxID=408172 RepID=A0A381W6X7_9ZZZZ
MLPPNGSPLSKWQMIYQMYPELPYFEL